MYLCPFQSILCTVRRQQTWCSDKDGPNETNDHNMHIMDIAKFPDELPGTEFVMIGLHGRNANKYAFFPFVRQMGFLNTQWLLPSAPFASPVAPDIRWWFEHEERNQEQIAHSRNLIDALVRSVLEQNVASENVFLVGFSQGAVMAVDTALRFPVRLGGVVALSGYIAYPETLTVERHPANQRLPIFLGHGLRDAVLSIDIGRRNNTELTGMGYSVDYHEYDTAHRISSDEVKNIRSFLHRHMYGYAEDDPRSRHEHVAPF
jgi:phospholipase/carboxylesterase